ncbi:SWIM zinc finger family protein [Actinacidiphila acidipaludis]|uniref:SWIM zinc finger family protein n=1 Tax=Actinacidiphila acidipaludis TaxID=2873382 RepID=A0ABS7Q756_9ACTN|nr:SWIM zinc finger family protein [Streptomyces acidipaludis]MBY8878967.1 SWIM zinc finger family protein [Streptomyces acidipaludis]
MSPAGRRTPRTPGTLRGQGTPRTPRTPGTPPTSDDPGTPAGRPGPPHTSGEQPTATRTFEALPPTKGSRAAFAESWWGQAWVAALEGSSLDSGRLQRGRTYARGGAVGEVTVAPGSASAQVHGSRPSPYRSSMRVRRLTDAQWDRLLDVIAERAAGIAALLDGEMPPELADDAEAAGVGLLPGPQDLEPRCNCPDWGYPCKHAAALCYQVARLLDRDPFVLLLLRGRGEDEVTDELGRRNLARAAAEAGATGDPAAHAAQAPGSTPAGPRTPQGDPAAAAFASRSALPPLPDLPPPPARPGRGPQLTEASAPAPGVDSAGLELLAADTALRAHRLLAAALDTAGHAASAIPVPLTTWQDTVRIAAAHPGHPQLFHRLAASGDGTVTRVAAAARAWQHGGLAALAVLEDAWDPAPAQLARAREALRSGWSDGPPPRLRRSRNRWTVEGRDVQLRYGQDGLWYPYAKEYGRWRPSGPPDADPSVALAALAGP